MEPEWIGIAGTGVMGFGLARLAVAKGFGVVVSSATPGRANELAGRLRELLDEAGGATGSVSSEPAALRECVAVLEATTEDLAAKHRALAEVESLVPPEALIATTTSSLSVTDVGAALRTPERFLGLHLFNPVHRMALVEVVAGMRTSPEALARGEDLTRRLGKTPVRVPDRTGFLVNRLLIPYLNQAARLAESGMATASDIDEAMRLGAGHPMGPFALIDLIGADVVLAIGRSLFDEYRRASHAPSPELRRRVAAGWLGRKTGRGYYRYE